MPYLIQSDPPAPLLASNYWSNEHGWGDAEQATLFDEPDKIPLPPGRSNPRFVEIDEQTVFGALLVNGLIAGHHESDLYAYDRSQTRDLIAEIAPDTVLSPFTSEIKGEGRLLDIAFAYLPFYTRTERAART